MDGEKARLNMLQRAHVDTNIKQMSNEELSDIISRCESAISEGSAEIEDYEAFVLCQKELARRTWV